MRLPGRGDHIIGWLCASKQARSTADMLSPTLASHQSVKDATRGKLEAGEKFWLQTLKNKCAPESTKTSTSLEASRAKPDLGCQPYITIAPTKAFSSDLFPTRRVFGEVPS